MIILNTDNRIILFLIFFRFGFTVGIRDRSLDWCGTPRFSLPNIEMTSILSSLLLFLAQVTQTVRPNRVRRFSLLRVVASKDVDLVHMHDCGVLSNTFFEQRNVFFLPFSAFKVEFVPITEVIYSIPALIAANTLVFQELYKDSYSLYIHTLRR